MDVEVTRRDGTSTLSITDDGAGFAVDGQPEGSHFGLRVLRDLVQELGGELEIQSEPGRGTTVRVELSQ